MKKQMLLLFLLPMLAFKVADWVTVNVDDRVSVSFPAQPEAKEMSGNPVWVQDIDANSRCMAMIIDFQKFGMDSAQLASEMAKPESFNDFKGGVLGQIQGSTLVSESNTTTQGHRTFAYVINMGKKDTASLNVMYNRNIFIGSKMYSLSFYEKNGRPQDEARNRFFSSFKAK